MNKFLALLLFGCIAFAADTSFNTDKLLFGKPTAANKTLVMRTSTATTGPGFRYNNGTTKMEYSDDGTTYNEFNQITSIYQFLTNVGFKTSVSANALTITLTQSDGASDCSTGSAICKIPFRATTAGSGGFNVRTVSAPLSLTIPSGTILASTVAPPDNYYYVYAIDVSGTVALAVSRLQHDSFVNAGAGQILVNTTAITGGNNYQQIYSSSAHTGVPIRLIGRFIANEATPGTWATNATVLELWPFPERLQIKTTQHIPLHIETFSIAQNGTVTEDGGADVMNGNCGTSGAGSANYSCTWNTGVWLSTPRCVASQTGPLLLSYNIGTLTTTNLTFNTAFAGANAQTITYWICIGF